jgi:hypothetical protein
MLIIRYDRVVSCLPLFVEQNINDEAPLKFQGKTRSKNIKDTSIKVIPQLTMFWDKHITLRITAMLSRKCLKLEDGDSA